MANTTMPEPEVLRVTVGVDTHKDAHVAAARDHLGRQIGTKVVATTPAGYKELLSWARDLGVVAAFGVEGTGSYGAGLARFLSAEGALVIEVIRPNRQRRRRNGKSDPADADAAAAAVLSGDANTTPKAGNANIEMIRVLRSARATASKARTQAICGLKSLVVTAPAELRESLRDLGTSRLVTTCARYRPGPPTDTTGATKLALRCFARRIEALEAELASPTSTSTGSSPRQLLSSLEPSASAPALLVHFSSLPATTRAGCAPRPPSRCSAVPRP